MNRKEFRFVAKTLAAAIMAVLVGFLAAVVMYLLIFMFFGL